MRGRVLTRRVVATSDVAALRTPSEVQPPTPGLETLHATRPARWNIWIDGPRHVCTSHYVPLNGRGKSHARHVRPRLGAAVLENPGRQTSAASASSSRSAPRGRLDQLVRPAGREPPLPSRDSRHSDLPLCGSGQRKQMQRGSHERLMTTRLSALMLGPDRQTTHSLFQHRRDRRQPEMLRLIAGAGHRQVAPKCDRPHERYACRP
jgi:hypothetical protein